MGCGILATLLLQGCFSVESTGRPPLAETFTAYELTREGALLGIARAGLTEVDVNSAIVVKVDQDVVRDQVLEATASVEDQRRLMDRVERLSAIFNTEKDVLDALEGGAAQGDAAQVLAVRRRMAVVADGIRRLARDAGQQGASSYRGYLAYLYGASSTLHRDAEELATRPDLKVTWELEAYTNGVRIHLPGYDDLASGDPTVALGTKRGEGAPSAPSSRGAATPAPPASSPGPSSQRSADGTPKPAATAGEQRTAIGAQVEEARRRVRELRSLQDTIEARAGALALQVSGQRLVPQGAALKQLVSWAARVERLLLKQDDRPESQQALLKVAGQVRQACGEVHASLARPEDTLKALADNVAPCRAAAGEVREEATRVTQELRPAQAPRGGRRTPRSGLEEALEAIPSDADHATLDAAMVWAELALAQIPASEASPPPASDEGAGAAGPPIQSTTIDLLRMEREAGDVLWYRPTLTIKRGETVESKIEGAPVNMVLVRNGAQVRIAPAVFFVQPFELADDEPAFRPLPAVSTTLHARIPRLSGQPVPCNLCRAYNIVDPGIGIHMMVLSLGQLKEDAAGRTTTTNNTFEIGMGGTVQLFGDIVQGGVGYDLQARRPYWFIGVGLQSLTDFGITIPGIERNRASGSTGGS